MSSALLVFGTRPEAIKMAPVVAALRAAGKVRPVVALTAQHREMVDQVVDLFGLPVNHDLDLFAPGQSLTRLAARALAALEPVLAQERPDMVVVQGDTTTTFAGALAAYYAGVPVAHVEAGLRSGDLSAPWPEEANRILTSRVTSLHLAPTPAAAQRLLAEGVARADVVITGNTVIDALRWVRRLARPSVGVAAEAAAHGGRVLLVTAHRRESWDSGMAAIGAAVGELARRFPDLLVVFPIHRNPAVRSAVLPPLAGMPNVRVVEPVAYDQLADLLDRADVVLTDSGGLQEEAPSLGTPVLVARTTTERPEAVEAGTVRLVGTGQDRIVAEVSRLLEDPAAHAAMARAVNPYGDGRAAARVAAAIAHRLGLGPPAEEFRPTG